MTRVDPNVSTKTLMCLPSMCLINTFIHMSNDNIKHILLRLNVCVS